jgi:signal transduction histidine kinase
MNAIIGMTDLVLGTELDAMQREYLVIAKDSADSLLALINDILDFSKVEADVALESETPDQTCLHFVVRDTGIGIPADKQQVVFDAFSQADTSTSRRFGGTGLGLAIATRLVSLMGGRIWVESEINRGSRFHFTVQFGLSKAGVIASSTTIRRTG